MENYVHQLLWLFSKFQLLISVSSLSAENFEKHSIHLESSFNFIPMQRHAFDCGTHSYSFPLIFYTLVWHKIMKAFCEFYVCSFVRFFSKLQEAKLKLIHYGLVKCKGLEVIKKAEVSNLWDWENSYVGILLMRNSRFLMWSYTDITI